MSSFRVASSYGDGIRQSRDIDVGEWNSELLALEQASRRLHTRIAIWYKDGITPGWSATGKLTSHYSLGALLDPLDAGA
jgi:hypothetical protein